MLVRSLRLLATPTLPARTAIAPLGPTLDDVERLAAPRRPSGAGPVGQGPSGGEPTLDDYERDATLPPPPSDTAMPGAEPIGGGYGGALLRRGARGATVSSLQTKLKAAGFDPGPVDGDFGPRTEAAVRRFQAARGLKVDGVVGPQTGGALGLTGQAPAPAQNGGLASRLRAHLHGRYWQVRHQCFRYAWNLVAASGGRSIGHAGVSHAGRGRSLGSLDGMVCSGQIRVGDVIYVNRRPGADPSSTNLAYGPHWFVYIGNGLFADQYGQRGGAAMAAFVPGRKIDTIYHAF